MTQITSQKEPEKDPIDLDVIYSELGFGKFELINFILICIPIMYGAVYTLSFVFTAGVPKYRCRVPECESTNLTVTEWLPFTVPFKYDNNPEYCSRYAPSNLILDSSTACAAANFNTSSIIECDEFTFENNEVTIANEWDMLCDKNKWKLTLAGTLNNIGKILCLPLAGYLSDHYGRKVALIIGMLCGCLFGTIRALSVNYYMFLSFEFLDTLLSSGVYGIAFVLGMECLGVKGRLIGGVILSAFYAVGAIIMAAIGYYFQNWRHMLLALYVPLVLCISFIWILPESLRWLLIRSRTKDISNIVQKAAKVNKIQLSDKTLAILENASNQVDKKEDDTQKSEKTSKSSSLLTVLKIPTLFFRMANCSFCWLTNSFVYMGLNLNAVTLAGNKYYNFAFTNIIEMPANLVVLLLVNKIGRKWSMCSSLMLAGLSCISFEFIPHSDVQLRFILYMIGKFSISISFTVIYVYTTEIFPTNVRNSLLSICSMFGRLGTLAAPQTPLLATIYPSLPLFLFGGASIIAGIFSLAFPDINNTKLPDTIEEAVNIGEKSSKPEVEITRL